jgi:hypothetical protein
VCEDQGANTEPNNSTALATSACQPAPCEISGSDGDGSKGYGGDKPSLKGTVGPGDVDYYRYRGKDTTFSVTDPAAKIDAGGLKLCIFTACDTETKEHECTTTGSFYEENELGMKGCCIVNAGEVKSNHDCAGSATDDDSADMFIRVTTEGNICVDYTVDFHF